ncbi:MULTISPECIES: hypothetical protein [unclassified Wolbachia]
MLQLQKRSLLGGCHSSAPFFVIPVSATRMTKEGVTPVSATRMTKKGVLG